MKWQDKVPDYQLTQGKLIIIGSTSGRQKLTTANLNEILDAVRRGFRDRFGRVHPITALTLSQLNLPTTRAIFEPFIRGLLETPSFRSLDFGLADTLSPPLTQEQLTSLIRLVVPHERLEVLKVKTQDNMETARLLADMINRNRSLRNFGCDILDDSLEYTVLRAALTTPNNLTHFELHCAQNPWFRPIIYSPVRREEIVKNNLTIRFPHGEVRVSGDPPRLTGQVLDKKDGPEHYGPNGLFGSPHHKRKRDPDDDASAAAAARGPGPRSAGA